MGFLGDLLATVFAWAVFIFAIKILVRAIHWIFSRMMKWLE